MYAEDLNMVTVNLVINVFMDMENSEKITNIEKKLKEIQKTSTKAETINKKEDLTRNLRNMRQ